MQAAAALATPDKVFDAYPVDSPTALHQDGDVSSEFGEAIQRLPKDRELGDYGYQLTVTREEASRDVETTRELVDEISAYLQSCLRAN